MESQLETREEFLHEEELDLLMKITLQMEAELEEAVKFSGRI